MYVYVAPTRRTDGPSGWGGTRPLRQAACATSGPAHRMRCGVLVRPCPVPVACCLPGLPADPVLWPGAATATQPCRASSSGCITPRIRSSSRSCLPSLSTKAMQPLRPDTRSRPTGEELEEKAGRGRPHLRTPAEKLEACGSPPRTLAALGLGARVACPQGRHASTDRRTASYRVLVAAIWQVPAVRHQRAVGGVGSNGVRTMAKSRRRQAGEGGIRPRPVRAF